jgi:hypothetical protein
MARTCQHCIKCQQQQPAAAIAATTPAAVAAAAAALPAGVASSVAQETSVLVRAHCALPCTCCAFIGCSCCNSSITVFGCCSRCSVLCCAVRCCVGVPVSHALQCQRVQPVGGLLAQAALSCGVHGLQADAPRALCVPHWGPGALQGGRPALLSRPAHSWSMLFLVQRHMPFSKYCGRAGKPL